MSEDTRQLIQRNRGELKRVAESDLACAPIAEALLDMARTEAKP